MSRNGKRNREYILYLIYKMEAAYLLYLNYLAVKHLYPRLYNMVAIINSMLQNTYYICIHFSVLHYLAASPIMNCPYTCMVELKMLKMTSCGMHLFDFLGDNDQQRRCVLINYNLI